MHIYSYKYIFMIFREIILVIGWIERKLTDIPKERSATPIQMQWQPRRGHGTQWRTHEGDQPGDFRHVNFGRLLAVRQRPPEVVQEVAK